MSKFVVSLLAVGLLLGGFQLPATAGDTATRDAAIVETLLRLKKFDVNSNAKLKAAVLRYLETQKGTPRYLELVEQFKLAGVDEELVRLAVEDPASTTGVRAARLLLQQDATKMLKQVIGGDDTKAATNLVSALGRVGNKQAVALLAPMVTDLKRGSEVRAAAAGGLAKNRNGEQILLQLVQSGKLPQDLTFVVGDLLHSSADEFVRKEVGKYIQLPATAAGEPLPTVAQLVKQSGDSMQGKKVFDTIGTCAKCHVVGKEGKEVGPNLSEIGSKLSRDAMYVSILDPSAGISHNFESYSVVTIEGTTVTGVKVSETDDAITLKTAEAILREIPKDDIDELKKQKVSLMPAGLQKTMKVEDLIDLVEYLATLKKTTP